MKLKAGYAYMATAAHSAERSNTDMRVTVCTTDNLTKFIGAPAHYTDPKAEEMKIMHLKARLDRSITDGRATMCSVLTRSIDNNQGMGDVKYGKFYGIYFSPSNLHETDGPYYHQEWQGMKHTTTIISGDMNALRLPAFVENLGHSNVIFTAGGGAVNHKGGPKQGAISCRQGEEAWRIWKPGALGEISLSTEYAKTHEEIKGALLTIQKDAEQIHPGWKKTRLHWRVLRADGQPRLAEESGRGSLL